MRERFTSLGGVIFEGCCVSSINVFQDTAVRSLYITLFVDSDRIECLKCIKLISEGITIKGGEDFVS